MASKRTAKRKKKGGTLEPSHWLAIWVFALSIVLISAAFRSPLTRLSVVRVSGVPNVLRPEIRRTLASVGKQSGLAIDTQSIEQRLEADPGVKSAEFKVNLFGRGRLKMEYLRPVAKLADGKVVDGTGNVFVNLTKYAPNLQISAKVEDFSTILTITDQAPLNRLARVAKKIQDLLPKLAGTLYFDGRDGISLRSEGLVVEFGDTSNLDRKVQVLAAKLREEPGLPSRGGRIVVVDPENAVQAR